MDSYSDALTLALVMNDEKLVGESLANVGHCLYFLMKNIIKGKEYL